jgi:hypothetical protein
LAIESVSVTPGSGKDIAVDTIDSKEFQIIKLAIGADGALDTLVDSGQQTMANSVPVVIASDQTDVKVTLDSEAVVLGAGTAGIGKLTANSGVDIGDVDVTSISAGDNVIGRVKLSDGTDVADILDLTNSNPLTVAIVDTNGDQIASFGGGTQYTEDAAAAANPVGNAQILVRADTPAGVTTTDGDNVAQRGTDFGAAYVTLLDSSGTEVSVGGGTQYDEDTAHVSGDKLTMAGVVRADTAAAQSGTDGDRTVLIVDASGRLHANVGACALPTGASTSANQDTAQTALDAIKTAVEVIDNAISGSEMQVDIVAALPAGANAIGKLAANSGVDIGDVDVTSLPTPIRGPGNPVVDSYTSVAVSAAANTANQSLVAAPGANKQIWVYGLVLTADTGDGSFSLQDEDDTAKSGVMEITRRGGFALNPSGNFSMPWFKVATNKALEIDTVTSGAKGIISYAIVDVS